MTNLAKMAEGLADNSPDNPYAPMPRPMLVSEDGKALYYDSGDGLRRFNVDTDEWMKATVPGMIADRVAGYAELEKGWSERNGPQAL